jgi:hypothetical protein
MFEVLLDLMDDFDLVLPEDKAQANGSMTERLMDGDLSGQYRDWQWDEA